MTRSETFSYKNQHDLDRIHETPSNVVSHLSKVTPRAYPVYPCTPQCNLAEEEGDEKGVNHFTSWKHKTQNTDNFQLSII